MPTPGWKSDYDGTVYPQGDKRLAGYGSPPSDPEAQKAYPGTGAWPLTRVMIPDA